MSVLTDKQKNYRNLVILQALTVSIALVLQDVLDLFSIGTDRRIYYAIYIMLAGFYFYLLWDLMRNLVKNRMLIWGVFGLLAFTFVLMMIVEFPFATLINNPVPSLITVHTCLFIVEVITIVIAFRDIFASKMVTANELWGSVSIFLMMAINFASLYDIINLSKPSSLGVQLEPGFIAYSESLYFSFCAITGGSSLFSNLNHLIRNISVMESVGGTLYLVIMIGRIIGMVQVKKAD